MALPRLTFARVKSARKVGDTTLLNIAVQTEGGEVSPGEIVAGGFVTGDSLIFGAMVGDKFVPWRNGRSVSSGATTYARITGSNSLGGGRFRYQWEEVVPDPDNPGEYISPDSPRDSDNDGFAYNGMETPNTSGGILGSGVNSDTLPAGFAPVRVGLGAVVEITGPFGEGSSAWWTFSVSTHVDGQCSGGGA